jgi:hypothetical protein
MMVNASIGHDITAEAMPTPDDWLQEITVLINALSYAV